MTNVRTIAFRTPDDMHIHLRQGQALRRYARRVSRSFARGIVMPNLLPAITTPQDLLSYRNRIQRFTRGFTPLMTFKLVPGLNRHQIAGLRGAEAVAGKYYPEGVTTNSENSIRSTEKLFGVLESMEEEGLVLCVHAEDPEAPVLSREQRFLPLIEEIVKRFPGLRLVFEHVSTKDAVDLVNDLPQNVAATVTVHHLLFTLEDMMASGFIPGLYCKPVVKTASDREAIQQVVLEGHPKFFFGSDSAPHPVAAKSKAPVASGVYSAPVAIPLLIEFFDTRGAIAKLENFVSRFGAEFYGLPLNRGTSEWLNIDRQVPDIVDGALPLYAGKKVLWKKKAAG